MRANPNGKGVYRWLKSAVIEHMHDELERDRAPEPEEVPVNREGAS